MLQKKEFSTYRICFKHLLHEQICIPSIFMLMKKCSVVELICDSKVLNGCLAYKKVLNLLHFVEK